MAARSDAAAKRSRLSTLCLIVFVCGCLLLTGLTEALSYNRAELLTIAGKVPTTSNWDFIPPEIRRPHSGITTLREALRRRWRRRGKRGGLKARLRANPHRPAILSLFLANARSPHNKMDELRLIETDYIESPGALCDDNIRDVAGFKHARRCYCASRPHCLQSGPQQSLR